MSVHSNKTYQKSNFNSTQDNAYNLLPAEDAVSLNEYDVKPSFRRRFCFYFMLYFLVLIFYFVKTWITLRILPLDFFWNDF